MNPREEIVAVVSFSLIHLFFTLTLLFDLLSGFVSGRQPLLLFLLLALLFLVGEAISLHQLRVIIGLGHADAVAHETDDA